MHVNDGRTLIRVADLADRIPTAEWQQHSCGPGAKGLRDYLWAWVTTATRPGEHRWLLIRRNRTTSELAFYLSRPSTCAGRLAWCRCTPS
ncbi:hypothetical protein [Micromonospora sp. NPDC049102]|uniref:hypothetical protein n=1 Tax=Micromonospora sp. NPDC049102 TaxID=3364265 RepID=UPI003710FAC6